jgi:iron complex transport system substrate-binding protein
MRGACAVAAMLASFATRVQTQSLTVRDGAGQLVTLRAPAMRIASVVPSATDLLVALGARDQLVARTRYDTARAVRGAVDVGGGLDPDLERLLSARPALLVAWRSQASVPWLARVRERGVAIYLVDTRDTATFLASVEALGTLAGRRAEATRARDAYRAALAPFVARQRAAGATRTGLYIVGTDGVFIAGPPSFVAQGLALAGLRSPLAGITQDFPAISLEQVIASDPDVLVLPWRRGAPRLAELRSMAGWRGLRAVREGRVLEVDGDAWSRPGLHFPQLVRSLASAVDSLSRPR